MVEFGAAGSWGEASTWKTTEGSRRRRLVTRATFLPSFSPPTTMDDGHSFRNHPHHTHIPTRESLPSIHHRRRLVVFPFKGLKLTFLPSSALLRPFLSQLVYAFVFDRIPLLSTLFRPLLSRRINVDAIKAAALRKKRLDIYGDEDRPVWSPSPRDQLETRTVSFRIALSSQVMAGHLLGTFRRSGVILSCSFLFR